jgi:isoleucyl-tRNA synthetase
MKFNEVSPQVSYKDVEAAVLEFWKARDIFGQTEQKPAPSGEFVFYEGPPTANGQPAMHHVLARAFKDIFPRFKVMNGFHVTRKGGWDTHGLPVEIAVEKKMGMKGRNHGSSRAELEEFNRLCRESVFSNIKDWNYFTERLGMWVDLENAYVTYKNEYIESVWNLLKRLWDKGLVERDFKVVPVSPRIGSTLSKAELGDENSYQMVDDPSVYVRLPVKLETTPEALKQSLEAQGVDLTKLEQPALIVWTTTPWTLPSNTLAAVNPNLEYVLCSSPMGHVIIAKNAVERISSLHKEAPPLEVLATFKGDLMHFWQYEQPFPEVFEELGLNKDKFSHRKAGTVGADSSHPRAHIVVLADFVGDEDGSGLAHQAPVYGAEDLEVGKSYDCVLCFGTNGNGIMQVTDERGKFFKDADKGLIKIMKERGVMYHAGTLKHRYPFHDRTGDPILYFARPSWFIRTEKMAKRMSETNQAINWVPEHIRDGRFGKWLEGNVDWGISRERYWGSPLPFWVSEDGRDYVCVGSVQELENLMGKKLENEDLHRPYIDDATFIKDGKKFSRVPEVLDVWFDSGAMPYAQWGLLVESQEHQSQNTIDQIAANRMILTNYLTDGYSIPRKSVIEVQDIVRSGKGSQFGNFEENLSRAAFFPDGNPVPDKEKIAKAMNFVQHFPADYICEAIDQTRGWFYSLHAIGTLLYDQPVYKNVICLGHLVDEKGAKMSKSKGNVVEPLPAFDKFGADSVRWYMFTGSEPGDTKRFSERLIAEAQRGFINTLWNVYSFFVLYANLDNPDLSTAPPLLERPEIDRWLISRLEGLTQTVTDALNNYDARKGGKALEAFVDELSNWYVRRNRRRFWTQDGAVDSSAYATLYEALVTVTKLAAPFTPFLAESLYQNLVCGVDSSAPESVHLCDFPKFNQSRFDAQLVSEMQVVIRTVDLGRAARGQANLKLRQPLQEVMLRARENADNLALERFSSTIAEELNVKTVKLLEEDTTLISYNLKPNLPTLGRKYGKNIPAIRTALQNSDSSKIVAHVNKGDNFTLETDDGAFELEPADVLVDAKSPEGFAAVEQDGLLVAFTTTLSQDLILEGLARDLLRAVQQARKDSGLEVSNRITLRLNLSGDTLEAAKAWEATLREDTLCDSLEYATPLPTDFVVSLEEGGQIGLAKV